MTLPTITALPTAPSRSNDSDTFVTLADAWVAAIDNMTDEINAFGAAVVDAANAFNYAGTSATSLTVGTGSKSLTIQTGLAFAVGQFVIIANTTTPANYMFGQVTSYTSGTGALVVNVSATGGSGTLAAWTVSLSASADALMRTGGTMAGLLTLIAAAAGQQSLIIPHGTAPTTPTNGSIWTTTAGLFAYINGTTYQLATTVDVSPINTQNAAYPIALTDINKTIYHTSATPHTWTIPANASVAFPIGTIINLVNENGAAAVTVAITTDTLRYGASTGSRTLAANGVATIQKVATTVWRMTGSGIS